MASPALTVWAKGAKKLKNVELLGRQDPYLKITCGSQVLKTKTDTDGGTAAFWNQEFTFNLASVDVDRECIYLEVKDKNMLSSTTIGITKVPLRDLPPDRTDVVVELVDSNGKKAGELDLGLRLLRGLAVQPRMPQLPQPMLYDPRGGLQPQGSPMQSPVPQMLQSGVPAPSPMGYPGPGGPSQGFAPPVVMAAVAATTPTPYQAIPPTGHPPPSLYPTNTVYTAPAPIPTNMYTPLATMSYAPHTVAPCTQPGITPYTAHTSTPYPAVQYGAATLSTPGVQYGAGPRPFVTGQAPGLAYAAVPYPAPHGATAVPFVVPSQAAPAHPQMYPGTYSPAGPMPVVQVMGAMAPAPHPQPHPQQQPLPVPQPQFPATPTHSTVVPTTPGLPYGWEERTAPDGRLYYVDHITKSTHWSKPPMGPPAYTP